MTPKDLGLRVGHVGINAENPEEAKRIAELFCGLLGLEYSETPVSCMAGLSVEVMRQPSRGANGHIGIHADSIEDAQPWFESKGFTFDDSTRRINEDGTTFLVYLNEEVAGFALHLTRE